MAARQPSRRDASPEHAIETTSTPVPPPPGYSVGAVTAAISNAVHHAIGHRIRDLPITQDKIISALR